MDNIGEIAYLIIVALIFLAQTLFGKKKKPSQKGGRERKSEPAKDPMEEIFGDFFGREEAEKPQPDYGERAEENEPFINEPYHEDGRVISTEREVANNPYQEYNQRKEKNKRSDKGLEFNSPHLQVEQLDDDEEGHAIDLREAVIHQIILERKFKI